MTNEPTRLSVDSLFRYLTKLYGESMREYIEWVKTHPPAVKPTKRL